MIVLKVLLFVLGAVITFFPLGATLVADVQSPTFPRKVYRKIFLGGVIILIIATLVTIFC